MTQWAGIAQAVKRLATNWRVRGSNPNGGEAFRTRPEWPWGPPSLDEGYRASFSGEKAAGTLRWPRTSSRADVKERVELYLFSPSLPSWSVLLWTLPSIFLYDDSSLLGCCGPPWTWLCAIEFTVTSYCFCFETDDEEPEATLIYFWIQYTITLWYN